MFVNALKNSTACRMLALLGAASMLHGCESPGPNGGKDPFAWLKPKSTQTTRNAPESPPSTGSTLNRLTTQDNGLAIRKWIVADDEQRISSVFMQYATDEVVPDAADERLKRNGFRLVRVNVDDIDSILAELGGASLDVTAWHGQVYDWRTIASHGIGRAGQPLAIDGHIRQFPAGEVQMVIRSWIVAMEDGPRVQFEMIPQFHRPQRTNVELLPGRDQARPVESFPSMAVDQLMERGSAYLLTCAPPQSDWTQQPELADEPEDDAPVSAPPASRRVGGGMGPPDMVGPDAIAPQTIGQWMLSNDIGRPSRIILVLMPRISDRLYAPGLTASAADDGR